MRMYSFVANLYLSPLQHGLQTAHVVSELSLLKYESYEKWAKDHKTIIICAAINSAGVNEAAEKLAYFAKKLGLPTAKFSEDIASLNGAPTACGIIVPALYYDAKPYKAEKVGFFGKLFGKSSKPKCAYYYDYPENDVSGIVTAYFKHNDVSAEFVKFLKSYRLA